jgi:hypothetical protein
LRSRWCPTFYYVFNVWYYLRFLLPALPSLFVLMASGIRAICLRLPKPATAAAALLLSLACITLPSRFTRDQFIFNQREFEQRHVRAAHYVAQLTPPRSIMLAVQHSGSLRYTQTGLRCDDYVAPTSWTRSSGSSRKRLPPHIVIDDWEETEFRARFANANRRGVSIGSRWCALGSPSADLRSGRALMTRPPARSVYCVLDCVDVPAHHEPGNALPNVRVIRAQYLISGGTPTPCRTARWWNAPAFYPIPGSLAFSESLLGLSLVSTPLNGRRTAGRLQHRLLITFPLSALGAYARARAGGTTTPRSSPDCCSALRHIASRTCRRFNAWRRSRCRSRCWLHRYLREPRRAGSWCSRWLLQAICNGYYLLFFAVVVGLWIVWFAAPVGREQSRALALTAENRGQRRAQRRLVTFLAILVAWAMASLPLVPLLWQCRAIHDRFGFVRTSAPFAILARIMAACPIPPVRSDGVAARLSPRGGGTVSGLTIVVLILAGWCWTGRAEQRTKRKSKSRGERAKNGAHDAMGRRVAVLLTIITAIALRCRPWGHGRLNRRRAGFFRGQFGETADLCAWPRGGVGVDGPGSGRAHAIAAGFYAVAAFLTWLSLGPAPTLMGGR